MDWKEEYALRCMNKELNMTLITESIQELKANLSKVFHKCNIEFNMEIEDKKIIVNERIIEIKMVNNHFFTFSYDKKVQGEIEPTKYVHLLLNGCFYECEFFRSDSRESKIRKEYYLRDSIDSIFEFLLQDFD